MNAVHVVQSFWNIFYERQCSCVISLREEVSLVLSNLFLSEEDRSLPIACIYTDTVGSVPTNSIGVLRYQSRPILSMKTTRLFDIKNYARISFSRPKNGNKLFDIRFLKFPSLEFWSNYGHNYIKQHQQPRACAANSISLAATTTVTLTTQIK